MPAKLYKFPDINVTKGYKIPLYTDEEIEITILVVNHFGNLSFKVCQDNLTKTDPIIIINSLREARESKLFSFIAEKLITKILSNVEEIPLREYM